MSQSHVQLVHFKTLHSPETMLVLLMNAKKHDAINNAANCGALEWLLCNTGVFHYTAE